MVPDGTAIICKDGVSADRFRQSMYLVRKTLRELGDTRFDSLQISISPHSRNILYIYPAERKEVAEGQEA